MLDVLDRWQGTIVAALAAMMGLIGWAMPRYVRALVADKAALAEVEALTAKVDSHAARLAVMEAAVMRLPTTDMIGEIKVQMADMRGDVKEMRAEVRTIKDVLGGGHWGSASR